MIEKLRSEMLNDRKRYMNTVLDLILQCMIKMLEPSLKILCRKEDKDEIKSAIP